MTFAIVFGAFVVAMLVIAVLAVRWAVGRDKAEKLSRDQARGSSPDSGIHP
jgi:hypothetical protein